MQRLGQEGLGWSFDERWWPEKQKTERFFHPPGFTSCSTCGKVLATQIKFKSSKLNPIIFTRLKKKQKS
ncbi:hypothetical protein ACOSQ3_016108 [Xanthoceras sorbifolium]